MDVSINTLVLLVIAALNIIAAILALQARTAAAAAQVSSDANSAGIKEIKVATDGMKTALVDAVGKASFAAGQDQQRTEAKAVAAGIAEASNAP